MVQGSASFLIASQYRNDGSGFILAASELCLEPLSLLTQRLVDKQKKPAKDVMSPAGLVWLRVLNHQMRTTRAFGDEP